MTAPAIAFTSLTVLTGVAVATGVAYALLLLASAARSPKPKAPKPAPSGPPESWKVAIVIPAHDEEEVIAGTLGSLAKQDFPEDRYSCLVIADNCTDRTADIARGMHATVWERTNDTERGKGYALAWAMSRLLAQPDAPDAVVIIDADTHAAPDFLRHLIAGLWERRDANGMAAVQGRYGVLNSTEGWRAALMAGAFDLINHVKPLGADRLGCSIDLKGNGMGFTRELLLAAPWSGRSITEDIDFGLDLLMNHDLVVGYIPEAKVLAQMPTNAAQAGSQRDRWELGRRLLRRERVAPLLSSGLSHGDPRRLEAAARLLLPPLAEQFAQCIGWALLVGAGVATGLLIGNRNIWMVLAVVPVGGLVVYLLTGLRVAGAPASAYTALLYAPGYAVWKFARLLLHAPRKNADGTFHWVRTSRIAPQEAPDLP